MTGSRRLARLVLMLATTATVSIGAEIKNEQKQVPDTLPLECDLTSLEKSVSLARASEEPRTESENVLTLQNALALTLRLNPGLAASEQDVLASEGLVQQSRARPNPELELEVEDFGGTDSMKGFDAAKTTARISQPFELGGKRRHREAVANAEARLVDWDYNETRRNKLAKTKRDFVNVLAAQEKLVLTDSSLALAETVLMTVDARVKAGKVPELEGNKATVEVSFARIERNRATRELEIVRKRLVANWGSGTPRFLNAEGSLGLIQDLDAPEALATTLDLTPEVARWTDALAASQGELALAKAQRTPDITLSAGVSRSEEEGSFSLVAGLSVPLPLFDRNVGNVEAAYRNTLSLEHKQRMARLDAETALGDILGQIETARTEAVAIRDALLPTAQQAFDAAEAGYQEGKFGFLDVLDAQRTLNEARTRQLDATTAYHQAVIDLECLTGTSLVTFDEQHSPTEN